MLYIIIPTYNEVENLPTLIKAIADLDLPIKIIVIDDNSPDGTGQLAQSLSKKFPVQVVSRKSKQGIGSAYILGFNLALEQGAKYIMEMDADWSHDPKDIPHLLEAVRQGADLAIGSRRVAGGEIIGWGPVRKLMSRGAMDFSRLVLGLKTKDVTAGFRCYRREILSSLTLNKINSSGYSFQEELVFLIEKKGGKIKEIPVIFKDRSRGKSKLSFWEVVRFFYVVLLLRVTDVEKYYQ